MGGARATRAQHQYRGWAGQGIGGAGRGALRPPQWLTQRCTREGRDTLAQGSSSSRDRKGDSERGIDGGRVQGVSVGCLCCHLARWLSRPSFYAMNISKITNKNSQTSTKMYR